MLTDENQIAVAFAIRGKGYRYFLMLSNEQPHCRSPTDFVLIYPKTKSNGGTTNG